MNKIYVDFSKEINKIKPLHGVNNGPCTYSFYHNTSEYFLKAGFPYSRLHNTEYPYGSGHFIDVPCIFKDFDADENNPDNYDFEFSDMYIKAITDVGTKVFYRLGVSSEFATKKRNIFPPKDFHKWARICEHIIRHYNEGWANGQFLGIEYFEIWSEPESNKMWTASPEEYFELYSVTSNYLKDVFGKKIKIGGCGTSFSDRQKAVNFTTEFLNYIGTGIKKAPLDFFSWHIFTDNLKEFEDTIKIVDETLKKFGFADSESIIDEWNYHNDTDQSFLDMRTEIGASFCAGALCIMQENDVALANYYDAQPSMRYCGIFSRETTYPTKAFYSFSAFNELYKLNSSYYTQSNNKSVKACASKDGDFTGILISCYDAKCNQLEIDIDGLKYSGNAEATVYSIDENNTFEVIYKEFFSSGKPKFGLTNLAHQVLYIKISPTY